MAVSIPPRELRIRAQLTAKLIAEGGGIGLTIADGYHRICASHHLNEDADITCRLVDLLPK